MLTNPDLQIPLLHQTDVVELCYFRLRIMLMFTQYGWKKYKEKNNICGHFTSLLFSL